MLDDTISNADDMETRTGLKVLASLPVDETEYDGAKTKRRKKKKTQSSKSDDSKNQSEYSSYNCILKDIIIHRCL